jgi:hypothetical protein
MPWNVVIGIYQAILVGALNRMLIGMWTVKTSHYASGGIWNV